MGNNARRQGRLKRARQDRSLLRPLSFTCEIEKGISFTVGQIVPVSYEGKRIPCRVTYVSETTATFEEVD